MSDSKNKIGFKTAFLSYLKQNRLRETFERKVIVETLSDCDKHFDLESLGNAIQNKGMRVSRATIYNTISLLVEAGLVHRQQFADGQYHYECIYQQISQSHIHTICTSCGKICDIKNATVTKELSRLKFGTFNTEYISLSIYGLCGKCARNMRRQTKASTQLKLFRS